MLKIQVLLVDVENRETRLNPFLSKRKLTRWIIAVELAVIVPENQMCFFLKHVLKGPFFWNCNLVQMHMFPIGGANLVNCGVTSWLMVAIRLETAYCMWYVRLIPLFTRFYACQVMQDYAGLLTVQWCTSQIRNAATFCTHILLQASTIRIAVFKGWTSYSQI